MEEAVLTDLTAGTMRWGSDAVAALLRELDIPYIALNPGASYRGLHDSLVNFLGNAGPEMLLCLHEDHVISIAQGYAKVTGKPLLAAVHSNVGLMHAAMGIFNAWCDRVPMLILGANGPLDAMKRRPWIDWIHTTQDQGALVRSYTKWDDQPSSIPAALESIVRARGITQTRPCAPVYVCLDAGLQEQPLDGPVALPDLTRYAPAAPVAPVPADVERVAGLLRSAENVAIIAGRVSRSVDGWRARIALAERLGAGVYTDRRIATSFPTAHPLHRGPLQRAAEQLRDASVILSLEALDLGGALRVAWGAERVSATVINCSQDRFVHNGWSKDHQILPQADVDLPVDPDVLVTLLLDAVGPVPAAPAVAPNGHAGRPPSSPVTSGNLLDMRALGTVLNEAVRERDTCFIHLPLAFDVGELVFRHPLDYLGQDGGGGVGSGPGIGVGAALALRGTGRFPITVIGDGDYLMGVTALWTAVANRIPLLVVVANNHSYYNDVEHQERVAHLRGRPVERKWIGQRLDGPAPDIAGFARDQGALGYGPIATLGDLQAAIQDAVARVDEGAVCVVDVHITVD